MIKKTALLAFLLLTGVSAARAPCSRLIPFSPALAQIVVEIGAGDRIIGITRWTTLPPEISLPIIGDQNAIDTELLLSVNPDCIVSQNSDPAPFEQIRAILPGLHYEFLPVETLADIRHAARRLGELTARTAEAERETARFDLALDAARRTPAHPPRALFVINTDRPLVAGTGTFIDELITNAGGINAGREVPGLTRWRNTDLETILRIRPDVIICQTFPPGNEQDVMDYWNRWTDLPAVSNRMVYVVTGQEWTIPSLRLADVAQELSDMLYGVGTHLKP